MSADDTDWLADVEAMVSELMKDPEKRAVVERQETKMAFVAVVRAVARGDSDDPAARDQLAPQLPPDAAVVDDAVDHLSALRVDYVTDRAFRLLTAAHDNTTVRPIDPAVRELFLAEARLGRMPLAAAFDYLVSLEPRLATLVDAARDMPKDGRLTRLHPSINEVVDETDLAGFGASGLIPLLRSDLAHAAVLDYLQWAHHQRALGDPTPVFARRLGVVVGIVGADDRPRAQN